MNDDDIETSIQEKNLTAPRVTLSDIVSEIHKEGYFNIPDTNITICTLTMKNGYVVIGHSACVSSENFDAELGEKIAKKNAMDQCWSLFGFRLASRKMGCEGNDDAE